MAVLIGGLDPFYLALLRGIEDVAAEDGTLVLIADARDSPALAEEMIRRLIARGVEGIVAVSLGEARDIPRTRRVPPIVYVDQPERSGHVLLFDGRRAGYLATRHLADHGHERIGIVTAPLSWPNVGEVCDGYVQAIEEGAGQLSPPLVSEVSEFSVDAGRIGLARLLDGPDAPSAVFAAGELLAYGVVAEARSRGIPIPGKLAIAGYVDSPVAGLFDPPLTMVAVPARESGVRAMRTLQQLMRGKTPRPRRTILDVQLVLRDSCGSHY